MKTRQERINELKILIDEFVKNGGNIQDKKINIPYYDRIVRIIIRDKKEGKESSFKSVYKECGYEYEEKLDFITIDRLKIEIKKHLDNGGSIQDKKDNIPYYKMLTRYIEKEKNNGRIITIEDVYRECGYEYEKKRLSELDYYFIFNDYKDADGNIDSIKSSFVGKEMLRKACMKAQKSGLDRNTYLACMYGVRLKESLANVNYIEIVENELKQFAYEYGKDKVNVSNLKRYNMNLYGKVRHLADFFPYGSISASGVLDFFGYEVNQLEKVVDEVSVINELNEMFPNREIVNISKHEALYTKVIKASAYNDQTVEQYLKAKGFKYETKNKDAYRLSRMVTSMSDSKYEKIVNLRKEMLNKSKILNNDNYSKQEKDEEYHKICTLIIKKINEMNNKR